MKRFVSVFFSILLSCALLAAVAYGVSVLTRSLFDILTSKEASVNNDGGEKNITVILDAGHGGIDGGAVGASGVKEKDLNLDLTLKLADKLSAEGVAVLLTRSEDALLTFDGATSKKSGDLQARLSIAESVENCVFVSIHMNRFPQSDVKGLTLYYSPNHLDSKRLAELMMARVVDQLQPENKRPIMEAGSSIYLLHRITKPAVLVECGFLSNSYEEALLSSEEYRDRLAGVLADAILAYLHGDNTAS